MVDAFVHGLRSGAELEHWSRAMLRSRLSEDFDAAIDSSLMDDCMVAPVVYRARAIRRSIRRSRPSEGLDPAIGDSGLVHERVGFEQGNVAMKD